MTEDESPVQLDGGRYLLEMGRNGSLSLTDEVNRDVIELTAQAALELLDYLAAHQGQFHRLVQETQERERKQR